MYLKQQPRQLYPSFRFYLLLFTFNRQCKGVLTLSTFTRPSDLLRQLTSVVQIDASSISILIPSRKLTPARSGRDGLFSSEPAVKAATWESGQYTDPEAGG